MSVSMGRIYHTPDQPAKASSAAMRDSVRLTPWTAKLYGPTIFVEGGDCGIIDAVDHVAPE